MKAFLRISYSESFREDYVVLSDFPLRVGRDPSCPIRLLGGTVSRAHGQLAVESGEIVFEDSGSLEGSYSEGKKIRRLPVVEGTRIRIGTATLTFSFLGFPVEKTLSGEPEELHPKNFIKKWCNLQGATVLAAILFAILFLTLENHFRRGDAFKNSVTSILLTGVAAPLVFFVGFMLVRKINRGEYGWQRSIFFAFLVVVFSKCMYLVEQLFCWFNTFEILWSLLVMQFLYVAIMFFISLNAVGKDMRQSYRLKRSLLVAGVLLALGYGAKFLVTGYQSDYELESCYSLTGWHWGQGEKLSEWQRWVDESAKNLR